MNRLARADRTLSIALSILFLPGAVVEETLHALGAIPFADSVAVEFRPGAGKWTTRVHWRDDAPAWAIRLAHLLPELLASAAGLAVIGWWAVGGAVWLPSTTTDWVLLSLLGAQFLALVIPTAADLDHSAADPDL